MRQGARGNRQGPRAVVALFTSIVDIHYCRDLDLKIDLIEFPAYSPDLNPCDYFVWDEVHRRMAKTNCKGNGSFVGFKTHRGQTAMDITPSVILKGVSSMEKRAQ